MSTASGGLSEPGDGLTAFLILEATRLAGGLLLASLLRPRGLPPSPHLLHQL